MTLRGTALLILLLVGLAGYLWLVEARPRPAQAPPSAAPLLDAPAAAVARVELKERGGHLVAHRGGDGRWVDAAGRPWRDDVLTDLVHALGTLAPVMTIDAEPEAPADYGLDARASQLSLLAADGRPLLTLELGERNPTSTGLYARRGGERAVVLVGAVLGWELDKVRGAAPVP
jgi:hypothetical protein